MGAGVRCWAPRGQRTALVPKPVLRREGDDRPCIERAALPRRVGNPDPYEAVYRTALGADAACGSTLRRRAASRADPCMCHTLLRYCDLRRNLLQTS